MLKISVSLLLGFMLIGTTLAQTTTKQSIQSCKLKVSTEHTHYCKTNTSKVLTVMLTYPKQVNSKLNKLAKNKVSCWKMKINNGCQANCFKGCTKVVALLKKHKEKLLSNIQQCSYEKRQLFWPYYDNLKKLAKVTASRKEGDINIPCTSDQQTTTQHKAASNL